MLNGWRFARWSLRKYLNLSCSSRQVCCLSIVRLILTACCSGLCDFQQAFAGCAQTRLVILTDRKWCNKKFPILFLLLLRAQLHLFLPLFFALYRSWRVSHSLVSIDTEVTVETETSIENVTKANEEVMTLLVLTILHLSNRSLS